MCFGIRGNEATGATLGSTDVGEGAREWIGVAHGPSLHGEVAAALRSVGEKSSPWGVIVDILTFTNKATANCQQGSLTLPISSSRLAAQQLALQYHPRVSV